MARDSVFRFKKFAVINNKSAMKVGTDGVLLGAWCDVSGSRRVLDVGTGTGLIALMVAQRSDATIDAVEIDIDASEEAQHNFCNSPWSNRLNVINDNFLTFAETAELKYDTIVSNPPFFTDSLKCPDGKRTTARHTAELNYKSLIESSRKILSDDGSIFLITPVEAEDVVEEAAQSIGLIIAKKTAVHSTPQSGTKRILWHLTLEQCTTQFEQLTIELTRHNYTDEYIDLTREFYLKM